jgi:methionine-rich copper-binding protein CopC
VNWRARSTWIVALLAICFSVFIPAGAASAHAGLEESEPKPSSWLATSPTEVVLYFDEPVGVVFARIKILDQEGNEVFEAKPIRDADDHTTVRANIDELGDGTWVVVWRVASADSHPVQGSFAFSIGTSSSDVTALLNGSVSTRHGLNNLFNFIRFVMFAGVIDTDRWSCAGDVWCAKVALNSHANEPVGSVDTCDCCKHPSFVRVWPSCVWGEGLQRYRSFVAR